MPNHTATLQCFARQTGASCHLRPVMLRPPRAQRQQGLHGQTLRARKETRTGCTENHLYGYFPG